MRRRAYYTERIDRFRSHAAWFASRLPEIPNERQSGKPICENCSWIATVNKKSYLVAVIYLDPWTSVRWELSRLEVSWCESELRVQGRDQGKGGFVYLWKHARRWSYRERVLIRRSGLKIEASTRSRRPVRDDAGWESAALSAAFNGKTMSLPGLFESSAHVETKVWPR